MHTNSGVRRVNACLDPDHAPGSQRRKETRQVAQLPLALRLHWLILLQYARSSLRCVRLFEHAAVQAIS